MKMVDTRPSGVTYRWTEHQYCPTCKQRWASWQRPGTCPECGGATLVDIEDERVIPPPQAPVKPTGPRGHNMVKMMTLNDKTQNLADWAKEWGITAPTIGYRLRQGWTFEKIYAVYHDAREKSAHYGRGKSYTQRGPRSKNQEIIVGKRRRALAQ